MSSHNAHRSPMKRNQNNWQANAAQKDADEVKKKMEPEAGGGITAFQKLVLVVVLAMVFGFTYNRRIKHFPCPTFQPPRGVDRNTFESKMPLGAKVAQAFVVNRPPSYGSQRVPVRVLLRKATDPAAKAFVDEIVEYLDKKFDTNECITYLDEQAKSSITEFGSIVHPDKPVHGARCRCRIVVDTNVNTTTPEVRQAYKGFMDGGAVSTAEELLPKVDLATASRILFVVAVPPDVSHDTMPERTAHMMNHKFSLDQPQ